MSNNNKKFILTSTLLVLLTFILAYYIANLLFYGKSSYEVYSNLNSKKSKLKKDIKILQYENAMLQKQYFELKNLEPEEI